MAEYEVGGVVYDYDPDEVDYEQDNRDMTFEEAVTAYGRRKTMRGLLGGRGHAYHEGLPGYDARQLYHDGCAECEFRAADPELCVTYLRSTAGAFERARQLADGKAEAVSEAEAPVLRMLAALAARLERDWGVARGVLGELRGWLGHPRRHHHRDHPGARPHGGVGAAAGVRAGAAAVLRGRVAAVGAGVGADATGRRRGVRAHPGAVRPGRPRLQVQLLRGRR